MTRVTPSARRDEHLLLARGQWLGGALGLGPFAAGRSAESCRRSTSRSCSSGSTAASASSKAGTPSRTRSSAARSAPSRPPCPASTSASCCRGRRRRCTTSPSSAASAPRTNSHSSGVDRIQRGDPKNRGVVYPYLRLGRRQAARPRRQRPAALRLDQAGQRRLPAAGRRLPRPEVRRPGLRRRQAAGEPAAPRRR